MVRYTLVYMYSVYNYCTLFDVSEDLSHGVTQRSSPWKRQQCVCDRVKVMKMKMRHDECRYGDEKPVN